MTIRRPYRFLAYFGLLIFIILMQKSSHAQEFEGNKISKGDLIISTGYSVPSALRVYLKREVDNPDINVRGYGPSILKIEYALFEKWTVGFSGFYNYSDVYWTADAKDFNGDLKPYRHGVQVWEGAAGLRINYYFLKKKNLNLYGGVGAGIGYANAETYALSPKERIYINHRFPPPYNFEGTVGARYFLTDKIGLYTELGVGQGFLLYRYYFIPAALAQFGLSLKL